MYFNKLHYCFLIFLLNHLSLLLQRPAAIRPKHQPGTGSCDKRRSHRCCRQSHASPRIRAALPGFFQLSPIPGKRRVLETSVQMQGKTSGRGAGYSFNTAEHPLGNTSQAEPRSPKDGDWVAQLWGFFVLQVEMEKGFAFLSNPKASGNRTVSSTLGTRGEKRDARRRRVHEVGGTQESSTLRCETRLGAGRSRVCLEQSGLKQSSGLSIYFVFTGERCPVLQAG